MTREEYVKKYHKLGEAMFEYCVVPTVSDFATTFVDNDEKAMAKIEKITSFTKNTDDMDLPGSFSCCVPVHYRPGCHHFRRFTCTGCRLYNPCFNRVIKCIQL